MVGLVHYMQVSVIYYIILGLGLGIHIPRACANPTPTRRKRLSRMTDGVPTKVCVLQPEMSKPCHRIVSGKLNSCNFRLEQIGRGAAVLPTFVYL